MTVDNVCNALQITEQECNTILENDTLPYFSISNSKRILKSSLIDYIGSQLNCIPSNNVVSYDKADSPPVNLDNLISFPDCVPLQGVDEMAYKINRAITIGGKKRWIHANSEQEYADKLADLIGGTTEQKEKHNFKKYALDWFNLYSKPNIASVTAESYNRNLNLYILPAFGDKAIEDITTNDVQALFNSMDKAKATKDKCRTVLNMILDMAVDDDLIPKNPLKSKRVKITGKASEATSVYSVEQMRYIISNLDRITSPRDRAYMAIQALHPLRLEEVLGLKWADIDIDSMMLHVQRVVTHPTRNLPEIKEPKTAASERYIDLHTIALNHLVRGKDSDFVIGGNKPLSYTQVRRMCERIQKDLEFDDKITPIRFRTTILTDIYDQSKDIKLAQAAAGHTTAAMTLKYYVKGRSTDGQVSGALDKAYFSEQ